MNVKGEVVTEKAGLVTHLTAFCLPAAITTALRAQAARLRPEQRFPRRKLAWQACPAAVAAVRRASQSHLCVKRIRGGGE